MTHNVETLTGDFFLEWFLAQGAANLHDIAALVAKTHPTDLGLWDPDQCIHILGTRHCRTNLMLVTWTRLSHVPYFAEKLFHKIAMSAHCVELANLFRYRTGGDSCVPPFPLHPGMIVRAWSHVNNAWFTTLVDTWLKTVTDRRRADFYAAVQNDGGQFVGHLLGEDVVGDDASVRSLRIRQWWSVLTTDRIWTAVQSHVQTLPEPARIREAEILASVLIRDFLEWSPLDLSTHWDVVRDRLGWLLKWPLSRQTLIDQMQMTKPHRYQAWRSQLFGTLISPVAELVAPPGESSPELLARTLESMYATGKAVAPTSSSNSNSNEHASLSLLVNSYEGVRCPISMIGNPLPRGRSASWPEASSILSDIVLDEWTRIQQQQVSRLPTERSRHYLVQFLNRTRHMCTTDVVRRLVTEVGGAYTSLGDYHGMRHGELLEQIMTRAMRSQEGYATFVRNVVFVKRRNTLAAWSSPVDLTHEQNDALMARAIERGWYRANTDPWFVTYRMLTRLCPPAFDRAFGTGPLVATTLRRNYPSEPNPSLSVAVMSELGLAAGVAERERLRAAWNRHRPVVDECWMTHERRRLRVRFVAANNDPMAGTWDANTREWRPRTIQTWTDYMIKSKASSIKRTSASGVRVRLDLSSKDDEPLFLFLPSRDIDVTAGGLCVTAAGHCHGLLDVAFDDAAAAPQPAAVVAPKAAEARKRKRPEGV